MYTQLRWNCKYSENKIFGKTWLLSKILRRTYTQNLKNLSGPKRPWKYECFWPTFGCKSRQNDLLLIKLKLDVSCYLTNVYNKFQVDISKYIEKADGQTERQAPGRTWVRDDRISNGRIKIQFSHLTMTVLHTNFSYVIYHKIKILIATKLNGVMMICFTMYVNACVGKEKTPECILQNFSVGGQYPTDT